MAQNGLVLQIMRQDLELINHDILSGSFVINKSKIKLFNSFFLMESTSRWQYCNYHNPKEDLYWPDGF